MPYANVNGLWVPVRRKVVPPPTIITAYLDESEDENRPRNETVSAIGGFVGNTDNWRGFGADWRAVMDGHGLEGVTFHTVDFEGGFKEPWKSLKKDKDRRESLLNGLLALFDKHKVCPYAVVLLVGEYDAMEDLAKRQWSEPYKLCFDQAVLKLIDLCEIRPGDRIRCVFDDNEKYRGWDREWYRHLREEFPQYAHIFMEELEFTSRHKSPEMEAADLFAYETRKIVYNGMTAVYRDLRYGFRKMVEAGHGIFRIDLSQVIDPSRRIRLANEDT